MREIYNTSAETDYGLFEQLGEVDWEAAFAGAVADIAASSENPDLSDELLLQRLDNLYDTASEEGMEFEKIQRRAYESMDGSGCGCGAATDSHGGAAKAEEEKKKRLLEAAKKAQTERDRRNKRIVEKTSWWEILLGAA